MRRIWREYRVELILALVILTGIFLLVERLSIRQTLWRWLSTAGGALIAGLTSALDALISFLSNRTMSDLTGIVLIIFAVGLLFWRVRRRIIRLPSLSDKACPKCGSELHRIHRAAGDRLIGLFLPMRRYRCRSSECNWTGLRISSPRRLSSKKPSEEQTPA